MLSPEVLPRTSRQQRRYEERLFQRKKLEFRTSLGLGLGLPMGGGGFAPIPGLGNLNDGLYADFRKGSLVPERGPTFSLTRATASTVHDHEGLVRNILSGEARFAGLRRVENLLTTTSEDFSNAAWNKTNATITAGVADPIGGTSAYTMTATGASADLWQALGGFAGRARRNSIWIRRRTGVGAVYLFNAGAGTTEITPNLTTSWQRLAAAVGTAGLDTGVRILVSGDAVDIWRAQSEEVTSQANQNPSEYVSKGVLSTPYHGAGVDGVKYFDTTNGNTVASNVVTEAAGTPLSTTRGIQPFGAATNIILQSEDHGTTWAAIAATSPTRVAANDRCGAVVLDLLGDDSAVLAAGYTQTLTYTGDATKAISVYLKAGTSTNSAIRLRDNTALADRLLVSIAWSGGVPTPTMTTGTHEGTDALGNGVYRLRFVTSSVTAANTNVLEVYPAADAALTVTNTGTVNVGGWQVQNAIRSFPYVKTTTAAVTVNADSIIADGSALINQTEGTLWTQAVGAIEANTNVMFRVDDGTTAEDVRLQVSAADTAQLIIVDGGVTQGAPSSGNVSGGTVFKHAGRYRLNDSVSALNGTVAAVDTACTMPTTTTFRLGYSNTANNPNTILQVIAYSRTGATDANLAIATAP